MPGAEDHRPRRLFSPVLVVSGFLLAVLAVGLHPAIDAMAHRYDKLPIAARKHLAEFDVESLPSFRRVEATMGWRAPVQEVGTDNKFNILFRHHGAIGSPLETDVSLHAVYYEDPDARVSHTPEVCYRQAGGIILSLSTTRIETPMLGPETPFVEAFLLEVERDGRRALVMYVLCTNGQYFADREKARFAMGMPGDRYTYLSKVEATAMWTEDVDREEILERCRLILAEAIYELVSTHFPLPEALRE